MGNRMWWFFVGMVIAVLGFSPVMSVAYGGADGIVQTAGDRFLSNNDIVGGLKEALRVGTDNAVRLVSKPNGYWSNPRIRIPLPDAIEQFEPPLRMVGFGPKIDEFERSMNRAAEKAAPKAKKLFIDALSRITFTDARRILEGRDNEATVYFRGKTERSLARVFKPIIHQTMSRVGVTKSYQDLERKVKAIPFAQFRRFNLDEFVTGKALDGLFYMLSEEERKIRKNPAFQINNLLRKIFGRS